MLGALGLMLVVVEDREALARIRPKLTKRGAMPAPGTIHWRQRRKKCFRHASDKNAQAIASRQQVGAADECPPCRETAKLDAHQNRTAGGARAVVIVARGMRTLIMGLGRPLDRHGAPAPWPRAT